MEYSCIGMCEERTMVEVIIVGAGPIGLACAIELKRVGVSAKIIEKGALLNSLLGYPTGMEFFSTPELLEIGGHPLASSRYKPIREEVIDYYLGVASQEKLDIHAYERVESIENTGSGLSVSTSEGVYDCRKVIIATGFFDQPNRLGVPGADLSKVLHYYKEPFPFVGQNVAVIGAKNSAAKVALECHRSGANVTLIHRGQTIGRTVKYWIRPDLENRIKNGEIAALFNSTVSEIRESEIIVQTPTESVSLSNDWVLAMTGYQPDFSFLSSVGIALHGKEQVPQFDPVTHESNIAGIYLAGTVCGGRNTSRWFIENGRIHAARIAAHIAGKPTPEETPRRQP